MVQSSSVLQNQPGKLLELLEHPFWSQSMQVFRYTRAYEDALILCHLVYDELQKHKDEFTELKYRKHLCSIYLSELSFLYKLDRWDDFLENWRNIFENVKIGITYSKSVRDRPGIQGFILEENQNYILVHFLCGIRSKKESVDRKVRKRNQGRKIGNLLHEQQSELTPEEIKERFQWVVGYHATGEYDFDPPASRQRLKRRKEKDNTVENRLVE